MAVHSRLMTPGPLLVWSGQERLATISTNAGSWNHGPGVLGKGSPDEGGELKHIFDENPMTFWHSHHSFVNKPKILKIEFKVWYNNFQFLIMKWTITICRILETHRTRSRWFGISDFQNLYFKYFRNQSTSIWLLFEKEWEVIHRGIVRNDILTFALSWMEIQRMNCAQIHQTVSITTLQIISRGASQQKTSELLSWFFEITRTLTYTT